jgi:hypothetical protein
MRSPISHAPAGAVGATDRCPKEIRPRRASVKLLGVFRLGDPATFTCPSSLALTSNPITRYSFCVRANLVECIIPMTSCVLFELVTDYKRA